MRRFLVSLAAMAALLFCVDRVVGEAMERLFLESHSDDGDLLGRGGMSTGFQYGVVEMMLKRHVPKVWIMEVEPDNYAFKEMSDRHSCFLPYAAKDPVAAELADSRGRYERLKRVSKMYPYNSLFISLIGERLGKAPQNRLGYVPLDGTLGQADAGDAAGAAGEGRGGQEWNPPADTAKMQRLRIVVRDLKAHGVHVLAVRSPEFLRTTGERDYDRHKGANLARVFTGLGVPYLDIDAGRYPRFRDPLLYRDPVHLNRRGALLFTRAIADTLRARRWL